MEVDADGQSRPMRKTITVRKIISRKTAALWEKENRALEGKPTETNRQTPRDKPAVKNGTPTPKRRSNGPQTPKEKPKEPASTKLGPLTPKGNSILKERPKRTPNPKLRPEAPAPPDDASWSQKVRRSYSRLSTPPPRPSLFGFDQLQTPAAAAWPRSELAAAVCPDGSVQPEPPRRKRRKQAPPLNAAAVELLAARMNAEFQRAEEFQLVVE